MIDILSFNKSLKATWIKKYLDTENGGSWKIFFDAELQRYGGKLAILGNLNSKDMHSVIKVSDPFVKESLEIWSEISFEETVTSYKHLRSVLLWHNSLHERTDKALTVSIVSRRDFFGFSWESVKICLTVGNQAIIAS